MRPTSAVEVCAAVRWAERLVALGSLAASFSNAGRYITSCTSTSAPCASRTRFSEGLCTARNPDAAAGAVEAIGESRLHHAVIHQRGSDFDFFVLHPRTACRD